MSTNTEKKQFLKEAVLQLIYYHTDFDSLLKETVDLGKHFSHGQELTEIVTSSLIGQIAASSGSSGGFHCTEYCASKLLTLSRSLSTCSPDDSQLRAQRQEEINVILNLIQDLIKTNRFQLPRFLNLICKESCISLFVLWPLHVAGVVTTETYFTFMEKKAETASRIANQIYACCQGEDMPMINDILAEIVCIAFGEPNNKADQGGARKVSLEVIADLIHRVTTTLDEENKEKRPVGPMLKAETLAHRVPLSVQTRAATYILSQFLTSTSGLTGTNAYEKQHTMRYASLQPDLLLWYKEILLALDTPMAVTHIKNTLEGQEVNYKYFLKFVSVCVVCTVDAASQLCDYASSLLTESLDSGNQTQMLHAFLLVRQCCQEGHHVFMSYQDWFQRTFGDESRSLANQKKSFTLLMKFLTDMVPHESLSHLKTHIFRPPYVPPKCRELLSDFVLLAKTRLADLEDPIDLTSDSADRQKITEQVQAEVEDILQQFESSGKVPVAVMEASIFRKPYFIGRFLPALLKPRPRPDFADTRMKFIEILKSKEKIPCGMITAYEEACKQESSKLLEGVWMELEDSDEDMEEMTLTPLEALESRLGSLVVTVCNGVERLSVSEHLSLVQEKLEILVKPEINLDDVNNAIDDSVRKHDVFDVDRFHRFPQSLVQVLDCLLNASSKMAHSCTCNSNPDWSWTQPFWTMVLGNKCITKALLYRVWTLIFDKGPELLSHQVHGLSSFLCVLALNSGDFPHVCTRNMEKEKLRLNLPLDLWGFLPVCTSNWKQFSLRFCTSFLQILFAITSDQDKVSEAVSDSFINKFQSLCLDLCMEVRGCPHHEINRTLYLAHALSTSQLYVNIKTVKHGVISSQTI